MIFAQHPSLFEDVQSHQYILSTSPESNDVAEVASVVEAELAAVDAEVEILGLHQDYRRIFVVCGVEEFRVEALQDHRQDPLENHQQVLLENHQQVPLEYLPQDHRQDHRQDHLLPQLRHLHQVAKVDLLVVVTEGQAGRIHDAGVLAGRVV
jgi:hypothetical protein